MTESTKTCSECGKPHYARGFCRNCYRSWARINLPPPQPRKKPGETLIERFLQRVDRRGPDECWPWTGTIQIGYGSITAGKGIKIAAHRLAYEHWVGPIPAESLDHECHNQAFARGECMGGDNCPHRRCCNPAHLIPRSKTDNWRRGAGLLALLARHDQPTDGAD